MKTTTAKWLKTIQLFLATIILTTSAQAQLHADFSADNTAGCAPLVVSFHDNSTGNPTQWKWDLGNGIISYVQHPSVSYFDPGVYTIKLIAQNSSGIDSVIKTSFITVYGKPIIAFNASNVTGCYPLKVQFSDITVAAGSTITQWQWDFGDGTVSTDQHPVHTYYSEGQFSVKLKATTSAGCFAVLTKPALIKVTGGVRADFSYATSGSCQPPTPVNFTSTSTGTGVLSYQWFFGDGGTSTDANPVHSYTAVGSYTVRLIATNILGCTDTLTKANAISIGAVHAAIVAADTVCAGAPVTFGNASTPATVSAQWFFSDGTTSTQTDAIKTFAAPGNYTVKLVNNFGSCKDSATKSIYVLPKPTAAFTITQGIPCSLPVSTQFMNTTVLGNYTYSWNFGDGTPASTDYSPLHNYTAQGDFNPALTVTDEKGCKDVFTQPLTIAVKRPVISNFLKLPVEGCVPYLLETGASVTSTESIVSYQWNFGDGGTSTDANPSHEYTVEGTYTVSLVVTNALGCTDTLSLDKAVKVGHKPHADFIASPADVCASSSVSFQDISTNGPVDQWFWSFGDGSTSAQQFPENQYNDTGFFSIKLIVWNNGCSDTLIKPNYVHVKPPISKFNIKWDCSNRLKIICEDNSKGAETYYWSFGDSTHSTDPNPQHVYAQGGIYEVKLYVTNSTCSHEFTRVAEVDPSIGVLTIVEQEACKNSNIHLAIDSVKPAFITGITWTIGSSTVATNIPAYTTSFSTAGNYNIGAIVGHLNGCSDSLTSVVPVKIYGPTAAFVPVSSYTCFGENVAFTDNSVTDGTHAIVNWQWNYGDGANANFNTSTGANHTYTAPGSYPVKLKVTDSYGCTDSIYKPNSVQIAKSVAGFTLADTGFCPNYQVNFINQSTGNNLAYLWSFGDGSTATGTSPSHTYTNQGSYTIKLVVTDPHGCADSLTKVDWVKVFTPIAKFAMSDSFAVCPPLLVNFSNSSLYATQHNWDFGDVANSVLVAPSHLYTYPGDYTVKLIVKNKGGCSDTATKKVLILGPTGSFTYNPTLACKPAAISFTGQTTNAVSSVWDFSNGVTQTSTATNPSISYTYALAGDYLPKMIVQDAQGCKVPILGTDTIHVKEIETHIATLPAVVCDSGYILFVDSTITNDQIASYYWNFGDGATSTQHYPYHQYTTSGGYSIKLVVTTAAGCKDSAIVNNRIRLISSPHVVVNSGNDVCKNSNISFAAVITNPDTSAIHWAWNFGNGQTATIQNPPAQTYTQPGTFPVTVTATNSSGCVDTVTKNIIVRALPPVNAGIDTVVCKGKTYMLHATGAISYTWNPHPSLSCTNCPGPIAAPGSNVMYTVTGTDAYKCVATDSVWVRVQQHLPLYIPPGDTLCLGQSIKLNAGGTNIYNWSPSLYLDNPNAAQVTVTPAKDTLMVYRLIGMDDHRCFADTGYVKIKTFPIPKMGLTDHDITLNVGSTYKMKTTHSADVTKWRWTPSRGLDNPSVAEPTATARESITYTVVASNDGNCVARDEIRITVICNDANIFIPNTFSPNKDGSNDIFYPRGKGLFTIKSMRIFNRWGEIVYERNNFAANDATQGWDGMFKGAPAPSDVYVFTVEVLCNNNTIVPVKGNVALLR